MTGKAPDTTVCIINGDDGLYIKFETDENPVITNYKNYNDPVYRDSCVEFFINAAPSANNNYMNFELNAIGTIYIGFGDDRNTSKPIIYDPNIMNIETKITDKGWCAKYFIPNSLLIEYFGKIEKTMKGNFYKCNEVIEHWGT